jgi:hypothetical protein
MIGGPPRVGKRIVPGPDDFPMFAPGGWRAFTTLAQGEFTMRV